MKFEEFVAANAIPPSRLVSYFLTLIGIERYKLLRNLCAPDRPKNKPIFELVSLLSNHLKPKPSVIIERFKFKECKQSSDETVNAYLARIKHMSLYCDFGEQLQTYIRDQMVWGLSNTRIQRRLLSEPHLTLERAVELSTAMGAAERDAKNLHPSTVDPTVNFVAKSKRQIGHNVPTGCFRCGKLNHVASKCRYKDFSCNTCGKKRTFVY